MAESDAGARQGFRLRVQVFQSLWLPFCVRAQAQAPTFHPAFCRSNRRLACRVGEQRLCLVLAVAPSAVALPFVLLYAILRPTRFACAVAGRLAGQTCLRLQGARAADKEARSAWRASIQQHGVSCDTTRRAPGVNDSRRSDNPALAFADEWRRVDLQGVALRSAETLLSTSSTPPPRYIHMYVMLPRRDMAARRLHARLRWWWRGNVRLLNHASHRHSSRPRLRLGVYIVDIAAFSQASGLQGKNSPPASTSRMRYGYEYHRLFARKSACAKALGADSARETA